jgi:hypothetical protein
MRRVDPVVVMVGVVAALVVAVFVCAYLDWVVTNWVNNPYVASSARDVFNQQYGFWFSGAMLMFGVVGAAVILLVSRSKLAIRLSLAVVFSSVVFLIASLEDWLYFTVGFLFYHSPYPAWSVNWSWMLQATLLNHGYFSTVDMLAWSLLWLFVGLPVGLVAIFKFPKLHPKQ